MEEENPKLDHPNSAHLFLQVTNDGISIVNNSTQWQEQIEINPATLLWNQLQDFDQFLIKNNISKKNIVEVHIEVIHSYFLLIPSEYNSDLFRMSYLEKAIGSKELIGKEVHSQECTKEESDFVFLVDSRWKDFFAFRFPLAKINYQHILANLINSHNRFLRSQLNIYLIHQKFAFIICRKNGKLQIANIFAYHSSIELAFYLHSVREAFELVWTNDLLQISGPDCKNNTLIQSLIDLKIPISLK